MPKQAKWKKFTKEEIEKIVKESFSVREVAEKLGYKKDGGGTINSLHKMFDELQLDTSHFKGQGWKKDDYDFESFAENSKPKKAEKARKALVFLRGHKCESCGLTEWMGQPINLQIHHVDGDRTNNSLENLLLLCPNCHSFTDNYAGKNINKKREKTDEEFVQVLKESTSIYAALKKLDLAGGHNYDRAYRLIEEYNIEHLQK